VLTLVGVLVLLGVGFMTWRYITSAIQSTPPAAPATLPAQTSGSAESKPGAAAPAANPQPPSQKKKLSFDEQARIVEKSSLAGIAMREGGCPKALPLYQEVLTIDPGNTKAYVAVKKCMDQAINKSTPLSAPPTPSEPAPNP
jgi:hypothetical protein